MKMCIGILAACAAAHAYAEDLPAAQYAAQVYQDGYIVYKNLDTVGSISISGCDSSSGQQCFNAYASVENPSQTPQIYVSANSTVPEIGSGSIGTITTHFEISSQNGQSSVPITISAFGSEAAGISNSLDSFAFSSVYTTLVSTSGRPQEIGACFDNGNGFCAFSHSDLPAGSSFSGSLVGNAVPNTVYSVSMYVDCKATTDSLTFDACAASAAYTVAVGPNFVLPPGYTLIQSPAAVPEPKVAFLFFAGLSLFGLLHRRARGTRKPSG